MKKLLLPLTVCFLIVTASSCAKCVTCKQRDMWQKFCDKDLDSDDQKGAINYYESQGWDCKKSVASY